MAFGDDTRRYLKKLHKAGRDVPRLIGEVAETATQIAVRKAVKSTPPNGGARIAGTNMRTGAMAQAWETDSITQPMGLALSGGGTAVTILANNQQYASYVNDGHRVTKHFVPGLIKNGRLLERSFDSDAGGIVVGTKTTYVKGLYIKEKANKAYQASVRSQLKYLTSGALK